MRGAIVMVSALVWCACSGDPSPNGAPDAGDAADNDADGYAAGADCNDFSAAVHPGASEICDLLDNDCDGAVDDDAGDASTWYVDADGDGYGDDAMTRVACGQPPGYAFHGGDCDDHDGAYHPGAFESCAYAIDFNCDGHVGLVDGDGDGAYACDECDDTDASVHPGATEVCNGRDDDCDLLIDDADTGVAGGTTWFGDADSDGYGVAAVTTVACQPPAGYVASSDDCDDAAATVHPGAVEVCDDLGIDEDCDQLVDDADTGVAGVGTWFGDADSDGYGVASVTTTSCLPPAGYVASGDDCNDDDATVNPGASEVCDPAGIDENCDQLANDDDPGALGSELWYADADADGFGDPATTTIACQAPPAHVANGADCDDGSATVYPAAVELCNGVDDDCDGAIDDGCV